MRVELAFLATATIAGIIILSDPILRSLRSILVVIGCGVVAVAVGLLGMAIATATSGPSQVPWLIAGAIAGGGPVLIAARFPGLLSSLPPTDWNEHQVISELRTALSKSSSSEATFHAWASRARSQLASMHPQPSEWRSVQESLLEQIDLVEQIVAKKPVARDAARAARARSDAAWAAAIRARRRFLR